MYNNANVTAAWLFIVQCCVWSQLFSLHAILYIIVAKTSDAAKTFLRKWQRTNLMFRILHQMGRYRYQWQQTPTVNHSHPPSLPHYQTSRSSRTRPFWPHHQIPKWANWRKMSCWEFWITFPGNTIASFFHNLDHAVIYMDVIVRICGCYSRRRTSHRWRKTEAKLQLLKLQVNIIVEILAELLSNHFNWKSRTAL